MSSTFARRANLAACLAAACFAGTAKAMPEDTFPMAPTRDAIIRWLVGNSDLSPDSVVTMTDELVVAITARQDGRGVGRSTRLTLREEIINPDAAAAWGGRSIQLDLDLDCSRHRVILGARRIYARPNLQGSARITRSDNAWSEVPPDTVVDDVARAACSPQPPAQLAAVRPAPAAINSPPPPAVQVAAAAPAPSAAAPPAPAVEPKASAAPPAPAEAPPPAKLAAAEPGAGRFVAFDPPAAVPETAPPLQPKAPTAPSKRPAAIAPQPTETQPPAAPGKLAPADPAPGRVAASEPPSPAPPAATTVTLAAPSGAAVAVVPAEPTAPPVVQIATADSSEVVHNPFTAAEADRPQAAKPPPRPAPVAASREPEFAVQIAAVTSAELARDSWQALKAKLPSLVGPRTFAVEPVETKGRTLYRALLLGFGSPDEAAAVCKELRSQSIDCILRQMK